MVVYQLINSKPRIFLYLLVFVIILSACGNIGEPPRPVIIQFTYPSNIMHFYEDYVTEFQEQNPHITVELDPISPSELSIIDPAEAEEIDSISPNEQSTWNPAESDVFISDAFDLSTLQSQNAILSLDPFIGRDSTFQVDDYYPGTLDFLTLHEETWALPAGTDLLVLYYNKGLFDEAGLSYPSQNWTWDQFLEAAQAITRPDDVPTPVYGYSPMDGLLDTLVFIGAQGGSIFDDIQIPNQVAFNDPLNVAAMERYADLFHKYQVAPTFSIANEHYSSSFPLYEGARRGRTGMWILLFSERGGNSDIGKWRFDWGMSPLPLGVSPYTPFFTDTIYVMSASTAHPEESWAWMSYLSQQLPQDTIPARRSLIESTEFETQVGTDLADVVRTSIPHAAPIHLQNWSDFFGQLGYFFQAVENIIEGTSTPKEALDWAQEQALK